MQQDTGGLSQEPPFVLLGTVNCVIYKDHEQMCCIDAISINQSIYQPINQSIKSIKQSDLSLTMFSPLSYT